MPTAKILLLTTMMASLVILGAMAIHRLTLVVALFRLKWSGKLDDPPAPKVALEDLPMVTVQLPIYNERFVASRLILAVAELEYPTQKLEVQILDDSTDDTTEIIAQTLKKMNRSQFYHIRRGSREGFKAGALEYGLESAQGEFVAIFDSDFVPGSDFLLRTIPYFFHDDGERTGMVQSRWEHLNTTKNVLTRIQGVLLDAHFTIEHLVRNRTGKFFNFNGTAGVWRKATIADAGGWSADTLTEDLDLSYRAQRKGWKFLYLNDVTVPAELPLTMRAFKTQQHRWVKGSIQTARKQLPEILSGGLSLGVKIEAIFHLLGNVAFPFVLLFVILFPFWMTLQETLEVPWYVFDLPFGISTIIFCAFYIFSQTHLNRPFWNWAPILPLIFAIGSGICINNSVALGEALVGVETPFVRTPKWADADEGIAYADNVDRSRIMKLNRDAIHGVITFTEFLLAAWSLLGIYILHVVLAMPMQLELIPVNLLFFIGFFYVATQTVLTTGRPLASCPTPQDVVE